MARIRWRYRSISVASVYVYYQMRRKQRATKSQKKCPYTLTYSSLGSLKRHQQIHASPPLPLNRWAREQQSRLTARYRIGWQGRMKTTLVTNRINTKSCLKSIGEWGVGSGKWVFKLGLGINRTKTDLVSVYTLFWSEKLYKTGLRLTRSIDCVKPCG